MRLARGPFFGACPRHNPPTLAPAALPRRGLFRLAAGCESSATKGPSFLFGWPSNFMPVKLCIDPGHAQDNTSRGLFDPGAEAGGLREADIAWQFANSLAYLCRIAKIDTYLTRTADSPAPLARRVQGAVDAKCTHWVSLHLNDSDNPTARGYEVLIRDRAVSGKWGLVCLEAAGAMYGQAADRLNRGLKFEVDSQHSRLAVMGFTAHGPTCLVELGFISNSGDRAILTTRDARIAFADRLIAYLKTL